MMDECYFHGHEPVPPDAYRICVECGHCFNTAQELIDLNNIVEHQMWFDWGQNEYPRPEPVTDADTIWICPLCSHDF